MSKLWVFPDQETLLVAAGLLPDSVISSPARMGQDAKGRIFVLPDASAQAEADRVLIGLGAVSLGEKDAPALTSVLCWGEGVALQAAELPGEALFVLPKEQVLSLASEMVRLGCDRQSIRLLPEFGLLRVSAPPIYTVYRAQEEGEVYGPGPREGIWVRFGKAHPWATHIRVPEKTLLLIDDSFQKGCHWKHLPDGPWQDVEELVDITLLNQPSPLEAIENPSRLKVPLRFGRTAPQSATLWLPTSKDDIDNLLRELPEEVLDRLEFAVIQSQPTDRILLRARTSTKGPPELDLPGTALYPHPHLPSLHLPVGCALEPPLRKARLNERVRLMDDEVGWILKKEGVLPGEPGLYLERIRLSAFQPMQQWVDYLMDRAQETLQTWVRSIDFDFEQLAVASMVVKEGEGEARTRSRSPSTRGAAEPKAPTVPAPPANQASPKATPQAAEARQRQLLRQDLTPDALTKTLREREKSFLELKAPADAPERVPLWLELGVLQFQVKRLREAGLCWVHAAWLDSGAVQEWAEGEQQASGTATSLLKSSTPSLDQVRAVAAAVAADQVVDRSAAQGWLDRFDTMLDLRSLWLSRLALAKAASDPLGLARARDRVLGALRNGLPAERNVPVFVRFSAAGAIDLSPKLEELHKLFHSTKRKKKETEPPDAQTFAGVDLIFAWGFARLGAVDRANALAGSARDTLKSIAPPATIKPEEVAGWRATLDLLSDSFYARIKQALQGEPLDIPLPAELRSSFNALVAFNKFKVERFQQSLRLIQDHERLDPFHTFSEAHKKPDPLMAQLAALGEIMDSRQLSAKLAELLAQNSVNDELTRLCEGVLEFLFLLPPSLVEPHLASLYKKLEQLPPPNQIWAWTQALLVSIVQRLDTTIPAARLQELLVKNPVEPATLEQVFIGFRRAGLITEAQELLEKLGAGANRMDKLVRAQGKLMFGQKEPPEIQDTMDFLKGQPGQADIQVPDRIKFTRAATASLVYASPERACAAVFELARQLPQISDIFSTNTHFCLSVLAFAEALVLGIVHEELGLGEAGRRWVEEDEHLLRRRIHSDFATFS